MAFRAVAGALEVGSPGMDVGGRHGVSGRGLRDGEAWDGGNAPGRALTPEVKHELAPNRSDA